MRPGSVSPGAIGFRHQQASLCYHQRQGMRFSKVKPTGSFRIARPLSRNDDRRSVLAHTATLPDARAEAAFWSKQSPRLIEIQECFPSGEWVTVETVSRDAEKLKTEARALQAQGAEASRRRAQALNRQLQKALGHLDPFWVRWSAFIDGEGGGRVGPSWRKDPW